MFHSILLKIGAGLIALGTIFSGHASPQYGNYNPTGGGTYRLQSSIGSTDTSFTLTSFKEPVSNLPYTMSYLNSSIEYGTIEPQSTTKEFVSFTGITQNSDGSATLTGVTRGLAFSYPFTASTTLQQTHPGQSIFILSNTPQFYQNFYNLNNVSTSTNTLVFSSTTPPKYDSVAAQAGGSFISTTSELASVAYVNSVALSAAPTAAEGVKGVVDLATALQQASSTSAGVSSSKLVLQGKYATDTPQTNCAVGYSTAGAGCTPIADLLGHIWSTIVANLGVANIFTKQNTFQATTSIAASSVTNNALTVNTVNYQYPSSAASVATSTISWIPSGGGVVGSFRANGLIYASTTPTSATASSASTTIFSFTLPANTLGSAGSVSCWLYGQGALTTGNSTQAEFSYGWATTTPDLVMSNTSGGSRLGFDVFRATIQAIGTASQKIAVFGDSPLNPNNNDHYSSASSISIDSTTAQPVQFVLKNSTTDTYTAQLVQCYAQ